MAPRVFAAYWRGKVLGSLDSTSISWGTAFCARSLPRAMAAKPRSVAFALPSRRISWPRASTPPIFLSVLTLNASPCSLT